MTYSIPSRGADERTARWWGDLNKLMAGAKDEPGPTRWRVRFTLPMASVPVAEMRVEAETAHAALGQDQVRRCLAVTGWDVTSVTKVRE